MLKSEGLRAYSAFNIQHLPFNIRHCRSRTLDDMRKTLLLLTAIAILIVPPAYATCGGGGGGGMGGAMPRGNSMSRPEAYVVPWKMLVPAEPTLNTPLVVLWFPADLKEAHDSDLNSSRNLTVYASQCVGLQVVKPDDAAALSKWEVGDKRPTALLVVDGKIVAHADANRGRLPVSSVENMIHHELSAREDALDQQL